MTITEGSAVVTISQNSPYKPLSGRGNHYKYSIYSLRDSSKHPVAEGVQYLASFIQPNFNFYVMIQFSFKISIFSKPGKDVAGEGKFAKRFDL